MSNSKISALTSATTPLAGTETLPIVQSSATTKVTVANLTAGRAVSALSVTLSGLTSGRVPYATTSGLLTDSSNLQFNGTNLGVGYTPNTWYSTFRAIQFGGYGSSVFGRSENSSSGIASNAYVNASGNWTYINSSFASYYQQLNGQHQWYTASSGTGGNPITFTTSMTSDASSNLTLNTGNLVIGTSGKGVNFTANTPASGMTSQLLNWYEQGTWTPSTAFATFVGAASSSGTYTRVGRQVTVNGTLTGATSVTVGASGILTTSLPFNASYDAIGSMAASTNTASGVVRVTGAYVVAVTTMAPVTSITFTATYFV